VNSEPKFLASDSALLVFYAEKAQQRDWAEVVWEISNKYYNYVEEFQKHPDN